MPKGDIPEGLRVQDKRYAGLADDNFLGVEGSFAYSENIDNIRNPKGIQLATAPTLIHAYGEPNPRQYLLTKWGVELVFFDFHIYSNGSLIYTLPGPFRGAIEDGNYIFVCYYTGTSETFVGDETTYNTTIDLFKLGYILLTNLASISGGNVDPNSNYRFWGTTTSVALFSTDAEFTIAAAGAVIYQWDNFTIRATATSPDGRGPFLTGGTALYDPDVVKIPLRNGIQVQEIVRFGNQYRVYANMADTEVGRSYCYLISDSDLANNSITSIIDLQDLQIRAVQNDNDRDWVLAGQDYKNSVLNLMSGTQSQNVNKERPLTTESFWYDVNTLYRSDFTLWKKFFVCGVQRVSGYAINLVGNRYEGYPLQTIAWLKSDIFYPVISRKNNYIILGDNNGNFYELYMGNDQSLITYSDSGYLTSRYFYGELVGNDKQYSVIQIGYSLPTGTTIEIQASNNNGAFTTVRTLSASNGDDQNMNVLIYRSDFGTLFDTDFNITQIQLILNSDITKTKTPVIYDVRSVYIENLKNTG